MTNKTDDRQITTLYMSRKMHDKLRDHAHETRLSQAEIIRRALKLYLKDHK